MRILLITFILILGAGAVAAIGNLPIVVLWNEDNSSRISIYCKPIFDNSGKVSDNEMECESTSTLFSTQSEHGTFEENWLKSDVKNFFSEDGNLLPENMEDITPMCTREIVGGFKTLLGVALEEGEQGPSAEELVKINAGMAQKHPVEMEDIRLSIEKLLGLCLKLDRTAMKELGRVAYDKETRTCSIRNQSLTEVYKKINNDVWVRQEGPDSSPCQKIRISTLRLPDGANFWEWEFEFKGISLDKNAESILGTSCALIDEKVDLYTHRSDPVFIGCDYMQ